MCTLSHTLRTVQLGHASHVISFLGRNVYEVADAVIEARFFMVLLHQQFPQFIIASLLPNRLEYALRLVTICEFMCKPKETGRCTLGTVETAGESAQTRIVS